MLGKPDSQVHFEMLNRHLSHFSWVWYLTFLSHLSATDKHSLGPVTLLLCTEDQNMVEPGNKKKKKNPMTQVKQDALSLNTRFFHVVLLWVGGSFHPSHIHSAHCKYLKHRNQGTFLLPLFYPQKWPLGVQVSEYQYVSDTSSFLGRTFTSVLFCNLTFCQYKYPKSVFTWVLGGLTDS